MRPDHLRATAGAEQLLRGTGGRLGEAVAHGCVQGAQLFGSRGGRSHDLQQPATQAGRIGAVQMSDKPHAHAQTPARHGDGRGVDTVATGPAHQAQGVADLA